MKRIFILLLASQLSAILADEFEEAGKSLGIQVWSIDTSEDAKPQICSPGSEHEFESNKNYIVLVTTKLKDAIGWNVYMRMGSHVMGESIMTTLLNAVKLGEKFKKDATYSLEFEKFESPLFKATFPSAFQLNAHKEPPKLYLVKGKTNISAVRISSRISSLNNEDCFVLDPGYLFDVFLLCGKGASDNEKKFARRFGNALLKKQHNDPWGQVQTLDDFNPGSDDLIFKAFLEHFDMASSVDTGKSGLVYGEDEEFEKRRENEIQLFEISRNSMHTEEKIITERPLKMNLLDPTLCYVVDTKSAAGIQIFIGQTSTWYEILGATIHALKITEPKLDEAEKKVETRGQQVLSTEIEKLKLHFMQQKQALRNPDFLLNFADLIEEYLGDLEIESSTTDEKLTT